MKTKGTYVIGTLVLIALPLLISAGDVQRAKNSYGKAQIIPAQEKVYELKETDPKPDYPGGLKKFYELVNKKVKVPDVLTDTVLKVKMNFIIEKDGSLTDIRPLEHNSQELADDLVRVLRLSEKWSPGYVKNKPIRTRYTLPVQLRIKV